MKYDNKLGIFGNLKRIYTEATKTNNTVSNNKAVADSTQASNEDIMCELDDADRIANIEEALIELEELIEGGN